LKFELEKKMELNLTNQAYNLVLYFSVFRSVLGDLPEFFRFKV